MIHLKIILNSGREFNISNIGANTIKEWIQKVLMPQGLAILWVDLHGEGNFIQVSQIETVQKLDESELEGFVEKDSELEGSVDKINDKLKENFG